MNIYADKVAVVTGAASGIGRELSEQLARHGAKVMMSDVDELKLREASAAVGDAATARAVDVADADAVQQLVDDTVDTHGRIDFMFNNAGICVIAEVLDMGLGDWARVLDVNLRGVIHGVHAAYPVMATQGFGHIVNVASVAGLAAAPHLAAYCTTKHAVVGLTRSLRAEAKGYGVNVSCVCPGFITTSIYESSKYINFGQDQMVDDLPFKLMKTDRCVRQILRGVARNKADIVITPHGRLIYGMQRVAPWLAAHYAVRQATRARGARPTLADSD